MELSGVIGVSSISPSTPVSHYSIRLPDRRLSFFFHHRGADRFAFFNQLDLAMRRESRSRRDQVTHDDVFLESAQVIDFAQRGRFGEHAGRVLEATPPR